MALLAATTLGVDAADTLRAEVQAEDDIVESRDYRLVVQSYDAQDEAMPGGRGRPVGSIQRAVTGAELRQGISVPLVELRARKNDGTNPVVVAWIEDGKPDLEFDGRMARPRPGSVYGLARRGPREASVQIRLNRRIAA